MPPLSPGAAAVLVCLALDAWKDITPLARNEFICWVEDAKQQTTRERRIRRTQEELEDGQRRPCCCQDATITTPPLVSGWRPAGGGRFGDSDQRHEAVRPAQRKRKSARCRLRP